MLFARRRSHREIVEFIALICGDRPAMGYEGLLDGMNLARLDSFEDTPAAMVLDRAGICSARDLMDLLCMVSVDAALAALEWADRSEFAPTAEAHELISRGFD